MYSLPISKSNKRFMHGYVYVYVYGAMVSIVRVLRARCGMLNVKGWQVDR